MRVRASVMGSVRAGVRARVALDWENFLRSSNRIRGGEHKVDS